MSSSDEPQAEYLKVDFDEVTKIFADLKDEVSGCEGIDDFIPLIQSHLEQIYDKYFNNGHYLLYSPDELFKLVQHAMDCINNITPEHIPYKSEYIDRQWRLFPISIEERANKSKPS